MKEQDSNIRDLFQKSLEQHQVPVDPAIWSNIQAGIGASGAASSGAASTSFFGTALGKIAAIAIAVAVSAGIYFVASNESTSESNPVATENISHNKEVIQKENTDNKVSTEPTQISDQGSKTVLGSEESVEVSSSDAFNTESLDDIEDYAEETLIEFEAEKTEQGIAETPTKEYSMIRGDYDENRIQNNSVNAESVIEVDEDFSAIFTYEREADDPMKFNFNPEYIDGAEYHWSFGNSDESTSVNPNYEYYDEGEYEVTLTVISNGKVEHSGVVISVFEPSQMFVPNVITPNNDNLNDYFDLEIRSKNISVIRLQVFDLAGHLVFESSDSIKRWDGYDRNGNLCSKGNYAFSFEALGLDGRTYRDSGILRVN